MKKHLFLLIAFVALTCGILLLAFLSINSILNKKDIYVNGKGTAVVKQIQKLGRLETASYTIEKVIDAGTTGNALKQLLFGDKLLLIANGQVIAGIDLSKISKDDITIRNMDITLRLKPAQILVSKLNNDQTRVYDRRQGILTKGNKDLETEARLAAEKIITQSTCDSNILEEATKNAKKQLTALLTSMGYVQVTIEIPRASKCP